jgi:O-antigen/teichoic acid export membrane protein
MAGVLGPQTIKASSVGNFRELRTILGWGSKILMYVAIPLFVGMILFGEELFVLWQGPDFRISGSVLIFLAIPQLFVMGVRPTVSIIKGLGYVRFGALVTLAQGAANLALTLLFVMGLGLGLYGVALGTLVPAVIFNCVVVAFVLRWIRYPGGRFVGNNVVRWAVMAALFGGICLAVNLLPGKEVWLWFALKVAGLILISFAVGWYVIFSKAERAKLRQKLAGLFGGGTQNTGAPPDVQ